MFSSPGMPKITETPSDSRHLTIISAAVAMLLLGSSSAGSHATLGQQAQRRQRIAARGGDEFVDRHRLVRTVRLISDRAGSEHHDGDTEVAGDEPAVTRGSP